MGFFSSKKDKKILSLNKTIADLSEKMSVIEADNVVLKNKVSELTEGTIYYEDTIKQKDGFIVSLNKQLEGFRVDVDVKDLKISELLDKVATLTKKLNEVEANKFKDGCIDSLHNTIELKDKRISELEGTVVSLENDIISLNKDLISVCNIDVNSNTDKNIDDIIKISLDTNISTYLTDLTNDNIVHNFMFFICNILRESSINIESRVTIDGFISIYRGLIVSSGESYLHPNRYNTLIIDDGYIPVDTALFNKYIEYHSGKYTMSDIDALIEVVVANDSLILAYYKSKNRLNSLPYLRSEAYYDDADFEEMNAFYSYLDGNAKESSVLHKEDTLSITTINLSNIEYIDTSLVPTKVKIYDNSIEVRSWLEAYCCICTYLNLCSASKSLNDLSDKPIWSYKGVDIVLLSEDTDSLNNSIVKPFDVGNGLYLSYHSDKVEDILSILVLLSNYIKETGNIELCFNSRIC